MPRDGAKTREKILNAAEPLLLAQGYGGTSIDSVIEGAGITKGAFFYHFKSKSDLAAALVERFAAADIAHYETFMARAEKLSSDPLQQLLIFIGLFIEMVEDLDASSPGCLYASYVYQSGLIGQDSLDTVASSFRFWRENLAAKIRQIMNQTPPRRPVDPEALADQMTVAFEGGFIMARSLGEPRAVAQAVEQYRDHVELLFVPREGDSSGRA
jgi:TetR/AcrR family transcriptional repressor of nem operon